MALLLLGCGQAQKRVFRGRKGTLANYFETTIKRSSFLFFPPTEGEKKYANFTLNLNYFNYILLFPLRCVFCAYINYN